MAFLEFYWASGGFCYVEVSGMYVWFSVGIDGWIEASDIVLFHWIPYQTYMRLIYLRWD